MTQANARICGVALATFALLATTNTARAGATRARCASARQYRSEANKQASFRRRNRRGRPRRRASPAR